MDKFAQLFHQPLLGSHLMCQPNRPQAVLQGTKEIPKDFLKRLFLWLKSRQHECGAELAPKRLKLSGVLGEIGECCQEAAC
jgi:hypothetical protein